MNENRTEIIETPAPTVEVREVREVNTVPRTTSTVTDVATPYTDAAHVEAVAYDPFENRRLAAYRVTQLVYWVFGLVEGLIAIRLILKALGANSTAGFSEFIYGITAPLVAPFSGLFSN